MELYIRQKYKTKEYFMSGDLKISDIIIAPNIMSQKKT